MLLAGHERNLACLKNGNLRQQIGPFTVYLMQVITKHMCNQMEKGRGMCLKNVCAVGIFWFRELHKGSFNAISTCV